MQKRKLKPLLYKSNHFNYAQLTLNDDIILSLRSDLFNKDSLHREVESLEKLTLLYNNNIISYNTLRFFIKKRNKVITFKSDYSFLKALVELSWESGILLNNDNKINNITFNTN